MASTLFSIGGLAATAGWFLLALALFLPALRRLAFFVSGWLVPGLLAFAYVVLLTAGREAFASGGYGSLFEVRALFANDEALAAGWLHYLAFDLFVGAWIARDALSRRVAPALIALMLPATFLFGPTGLLLYIGVLLTTRRWRAREAVS